MSSIDYEFNTTCRDYSRQPVFPIPKEDYETLLRRCGLDSLVGIRVRVNVVVEL